MTRLSLNLATTRLILTHGHEGTDAAGHVIEAFGGFIMGGNYVIGLIVFAILVLVNFIVITKGSGRIAEVSARFSLDAMPGKQMAIDADLSAGLIDEKDARARRKALEDESNFFGSMDGAAKFVRGDAIAGLIITFINIIGGIIIGVAQQDLSMAEAAKSYTLLTVGDGLVTQIPALIVSTAAGMLVTKAGVDGSTDKALFSQLSGYPAALGMSSFLMATMAVLPGIPAIPFLLLAGLAGGAAFLLSRKQRRAAAQAVTTQAQQVAAAPVMDEPISTALSIDAVRIELGYGLLGLINAEQGHRLTDQIKALRRQLAGEMGFILPAVRIQDNLQINANSYVVRVKEIEAGRGDLRPNMLLVMDPRGDKINLAGEETVEPTFGLPAMWVDSTPARGGPVPRLYRGRSVHRHHHAPDRAHQGQHVGAAVARRDAEAARRIAEGAPEAGRRPDPRPDLGQRRAARAAVPARRAGLDPRPAERAGRHLRGLRLFAQRHHDHRACARAPGPADQRHLHRPDRRHSDPDPVAGMGAGLHRGAASARARRSSW